MRLAAVAVLALASTAAARAPCIFEDPPSPQTPPTVAQMYADLMACGFPFVSPGGPITAACEWEAVYPWWQSVFVNGRPCEEGWLGYVMRICGCQ